MTRNWIRSPASRIRSWANATCGLRPVAIASAEVMAPCVLWVDEIEKGLSVSDSDGGTSRRILGTLLTWMAERSEPIFMVATANDIDILPPELVRKGRFDEIFFVDLPTAPVRQSVLEIHLRRRELDPAGFDLASLVEASEGFSGAELEQAVVSAIYAAHARGDRPGTEDIMQAVRGTQPLSVVMRERVQALRDWAAGRGGNGSGWAGVRP
jgi:SpoVK/Ycf46/Vps4 family AAA+-type ATPase